MGNTKTDGAASGEHTRQMLRSTQKDKEDTSAFLWL